MSDTNPNQDNNEGHAPSLTQFLHQLWQHLSLWQEQAGATATLAKTEAKLSARALLIVVGLIVAVALTSVVIWLCFVAAIAVAIYSLSDSALLTTALVIGAQFLLLWWLIKELKQAIGHIGFNRTFTSIRNKKPDEADTNEHAQTPQPSAQDKEQSHAE